jgi:hypothetical protein
MKKYPVYMKPTFGVAHKLLSCFKTVLVWRDVNKSPICEYCKKPIAPSEPMAMREIQVSWFRGDDEVEYYHQACWGKFKRGEQ